MSFDELVVLLAKEPRPGFAKTRLAAGVGVESAHRLARAFIDDTLGLLARAVEGRTDRGAVVALASADGPQEARQETQEERGDARSWFRHRADAQGLVAELWPQRSGDLGARIAGVFEDGLARGAKRVVVMGMDTPHLGTARLDEAFSALRGGTDAILGPTEDGGYYLIGLRAPAPGLFTDVPWSTPDVFEVTRARAREAGLDLESLAPEFDVDEVSDLERLRTLLSEGAATCPATSAALFTEP